MDRCGELGSWEAGRSEEQRERPQPRAVAISGDGGARVALGRDATVVALESGNRESRNN